MANEFFLIFLGTIIVSRLVLLNRKIYSPTIFGVRLHHYMYGIILTMISFLISDIYLYAIGLGLFVDQLPLFFIWRKWEWKDCYSIYYFVKLFICVLVIFLLKNYLILHF